MPRPPTDCSDLSLVALVIGVVAGLAANHAGWNPWLWGLVAWMAALVLFALLCAHVDGGSN